MRSIYLIQFLLLSVFANAQDGLQGIIVERYYESTKQDNSASIQSGELEEGSVTYRIYVDLKPGYTFQAAFGAPGHPLFFQSTKPFFNHIDAGTTHPNILPERALKKDVALLDSWLSVGAAGENHLGVMKEFDTDGSDEFLHFENGFLDGVQRRHDYSLRSRNGLMRCDSLPFPTFFQMDSALKVLGSATVGNRIEINNGAWASMGKGSFGADSLSNNKVLIAQLTTAGDLSFELNLLIGAPNRTSQKYVAKNPEFGEWMHKDLTFNSNKRKRHQSGNNRKIKQKNIS